MAVKSLDEEAIFHAARRIAAGVERATFVKQACGGDSVLEKRVHALIEMHERDSKFLEAPAVNPNGTIDEVPLAERPGSRVGPYRLMEQIGEGGFGVVFVAEQQEPVRRKVALKLIKPGMDSRQVIARFEAERQALALMDHPNIAKVLDAGATDSGRPYFVMELVRGIPITGYCDQTQLSPRDRLDLFITVCQAIQHAHQKGIIHRDIKPSNVLVTSHDGKPVAKVIDFGVAKAIHQHLTERTIYTNFAQMVGTPLYMSPEQAEMSGLDIDTRSDIYSLGVLLYELLTGTTPLEKKQVAKAAYDEIRRLIREEEPPKPSTRLSQTGGSLPSVAAQRKMEPAKLSRLMRGDLDWITMKALEKDRTRRYETASGLARDVQRYLGDEPVEACPPSATYRLRKFARKNRTLLTTAATVASLLVGGVVVSTVLALRATRAERAADAARVEESRQRLIAEDQRNEAQTQRAQAEANFQKSRQAVDEYFTLISESKLFDVQGLQPLRKDLLEAALRFYQKFAVERTDDPAVLADLAVTTLRVAEIYHAIDRNDDAVAALKRALDVIDRLRRDYPKAAEQHRRLAGFWKGSRRLQAATMMPRDQSGAAESLDRFVRTWENFVIENPSVAAFQSDLAAIHLHLGDLYQSARSNDRASFHLGRAEALLTTLTATHSEPALRADLALVLQYLSGNRTLRGDRAAAVAASRRSLALRTQLAAEDPGSPIYRNDLASSLWQLGDLLADGEPQEADALCRRAIEINLALAREFPSQRLYREEASRNLVGRGLRLVKSGKRTEGAGLCRQAIAINQNWVKDNPDDLIALTTLGHSYRHLAGNTDRTEEIDDALRKSIESFDRVARGEPANFEPRYFAANSYQWLAGRILERGDRQGGVDCLTKAISMSEEGLEHDAPTSPFRQELQEEYMRRAGVLAALGRAADAQKDWDRVIDLTRGPRRNDVRLMRAIALARAGDHRRAVAEAEDLSQGDKVPVNALYNAACVFSVAGTKVGADATLEEQYAMRAVLLLRRAQAADYFKDRRRIEHMKTDKDLDPLRQRADYAQLLKELDAKAN